MRIKAISHRYLTRRLLLLIFLGFSTIIFYIMILSDYNSNTDDRRVRNPYLITKKQMHSLHENILRRECDFPHLKTFSPEIAPYLGQRNSGINCPKFVNSEFSKIIWTQERGKSILKRTQPGEVECCYQPFVRIDDNHDRMMDTCFPLIGNVSEIPSEHEFIDISCTIKGISQPHYEDGFVFVNRKPEVENRIKKYFSNSEHTMRDKMNVVVLGIDATSRLNFHRMAPKSSEYLLSTLEAIEMKGYTKVAENTYPNLIPLLTGEFREDFDKSKCIDNRKEYWETHLDDCPFIWKQFSESGYKTGYAEDDNFIGNFYLYWDYAFKKPPTDYYFRPYATHMERKSPDPEKYCYGSRLTFQTLLDNLENTAEVFKNDLFFHFTWTTKLTHHGANGDLNIGDEPLLNFLTYMKNSNALNNTALFLLSDHGNRNNRMRSTHQGRIEDRMPMLFIVLPSWFSSKYKLAYQNILENTNKLTSAFDVHKTLMDFMNLQRLEDHNINEDVTRIDNVEKNTKQSLSLFNRIPSDRLCYEAGVSLHWCVCYKTEKVFPLTSEDVTKAVNFTIDSINHLLRDHKECPRLYLDQIEDAYRVQLDNRNSSNRTNDVMALRVSFSVLPSNGKFEATVVRDQNGQWGLTDRVTRTNLYFDKGFCVGHDLKPFCYCSNWSWKAIWYFGKKYYDLGKL